jgi:hypothetical protein
MPSRLPASPVLAVVGAVALVAGCSRDLSTLELASFPNDAAVFLDGFGPGVDFQAFGGSKTDALSIDATVRHSGTTSLRVTVPGPGDPTGGYAGGAFVSNVGRDLSGYNALTFWARASRAITLNTAGLGNDNTGNSRYVAETGGIPLSPAWTKVILPIPLAAKLTRERGLFFFAEGFENDAGFDIWFDDVQFEFVAGLGAPSPAIATRTVAAEVGNEVRLTGTVATWSINGSDRVMTASPNYFTAMSSNTDVATVTGEGTVSVVGLGSSVITAMLGAVPAAGEITLNVGSGPVTAAPTPTRAAADVISVFSNAYPNVPVAFFAADFDPADVTDLQIAGDDVKRYDGLGFSVLELAAPRVDASAMTGFHIDVYTAAAPFRVKLVDFGADGAFGGGDDSEFEVTLDAASTPALTPDAWSSLDLPFTLFPGLAARAHISQIVFSGGAPTVYIDNMYFYRDVVPTAPTAAAPTPTYGAADVISMFSNAYTNVPVDTWSTGWDVTDFADAQVAGNDVKLYTNLVFAGIETIGTPINATAMTHFRMDIWTPDPVAAPVVFRIKWVDLGADGVFGGGNETESEITLTAASTPALRQGQWTTLDIPFSAFPPGLAARAHLGQLIISGNLSTVYVDNVLLHK